jgi:hypothetical protein
MFSVDVLALTGSDGMERLQTGGGNQPAHGDHQLPAGSQRMQPPGQPRYKLVRMTLAEFQRSLAARTPPRDLAPPLAALWWANKGDWDKAHKIVMDESGRAAAWVHAWLHRVEGDAANAAYWYRQAERPVASGAHDAEWAAIATALLGEAA